MIDTTLPPEVAAARIGRLTASRISEAVAKTSAGKWGAGRANLMAELILERLLGVAAERYVSKDMLWGIETEPQARAAYEFFRDTAVTLPGFVPHPVIWMSGATPDGAVGPDGLIEIKCPSSATHLDFLLTDEVDKRYRDQMAWQMACTGRKWCDFASFDPRFPAELQLRVRRFERDEKIIATLENDARLFLAELDDKCAALVQQMGGTP